MFPYKSILTLMGFFSCYGRHNKHKHTKKTILTHQHTYYITMSCCYSFAYICTVCIHRVCMCVGGVGMALTRLRLFCGVPPPWGVLLPEEDPEVVPNAGDIPIPPVCL